MTDPVNLIRRASAPLPLLPPPDLPPDLEALNRSFDTGDIRAVIFDVYGTLFISAAGDIGTGDDHPHHSLDSLAGEYGLSAEELRGYFRGEVLKRHGELRRKTMYPELRVEEIWADFLAMKVKLHRDSVRGTSHLVDDSRELALRYELTVNPVYPMPGAEETLRILRDRNITLGLISNAQFFTPLLFDAFFGASPEALGFDRELLIYSFERGEAKPSPNLFAPAVRRLEVLGLKPENALYVGNDMLNDIFAGARAGFKTALFAGDRRSLRLREGDMQVQGIMPDWVIRSWQALQ
jgi:putative hydrolase of the HAD superfamily